MRTELQLLNPAIDANCEMTRRTVLLALDLIRAQVAGDRLEALELAGLSPGKTKKKEEDPNGVTAQLQDYMRAGQLTRTTIARADMGRYGAQSALTREAIKHGELPEFFGNPWALDLEIAPDAAQAAARVNASKNGIGNASALLAQLERVQLFMLAIGGRHLEGPREYCAITTHCTMTGPDGKVEIWRYTAETVGRYMSYFRKGAALHQNEAGILKVVENIAERVAFRTKHGLICGAAVMEALDGQSFSSVLELVGGRNRLGSEVARNEHKADTKTDRAICRAYNKGNCPRGRECSHRHACAVCGALGHPQENCWSKQGKGGGRVRSRSREREERRGGNRGGAPDYRRYEKRDDRRDDRRVPRDGRRY